MAKIKPGTKHPNKRGLVMGKNGRYVSKSTYAKQLKATASTQIRPKGKSKPTSKTTPRGRPQLPPAGKTSAKTTPRGRASAKRAMARAKQVRAAQGTRTPGVRTGQPAGAANRVYGASRVGPAVRRAQRSAFLQSAKGAAKAGLRGVGRLVAGRDDGSGSALLAASAANDAINAARGTTSEQRRISRMYAQSIAGKAKRTRSRSGNINRRGRVVSRGKPKTTPVSNRSKFPGLAKTANSRTTQVSGKQKPAEKNPANTKPASTTKPTVVTKPPTAKPTAKPTSKPTQAKTQTKAKSSPKPTGSVLSRELAGAKTFIKKFKGKKGMERAVAKMEAREKRLKKDLKIFESVV
tara:strand:+ start:1462 stop:2511 length:1050 start_codon:yes stop_codon:yes gene_type:complete